MNRSYSYQPKQVEDIVIRPFAFEFPADLDPVWIPGNRARSHFFNGTSLTMPYLEPFLVKTMREAAEHISDPELLKDIRGFNGQEANHYKCHRKLNERLRNNGYPGFAEIEERLDRSYQKLLTRSLRTRLAYSAGFECMTNGFTTWLIRRRRELFFGAAPSVTSFWLMHMVEETEHKTVAFDAYMAFSGAYLPRALGVFHGSFHVLGYAVLGMFHALKADGVLKQPGAWIEILRELLSINWHVGPFLLRALLPRHNPRGESDPEWMKAWVEGHASHPVEEALPLIDTSNPSMPVPFGRTATL